MIDCVESSAASRRSSPRARLAPVRRQKVTALACVIGSMKLTDAPPSTQSMRTWLKPSMSRSPSVSSWRMRMASVPASMAASASRGRCALAGEHDQIAHGPARAVAKHGWLVELHGQTVILIEPVGHTPDRQLETPLAHPDLLVDADLARCALVGHARACRQLDLDDLQRRGKVCRRNIPPYVAGLRIAPAHAPGAPRDWIDRRCGIGEQ